MRGFYIRGPFATIARLDAMVAFFAAALAHLGDPGSEDERRVKAVLILANPVHALNLLKSYQAWVTTARPTNRPTTRPTKPTAGAVTCPRAAGGGLVEVPARRHRLRPPLRRGRGRRHRPDRRGRSAHRDLGPRAPRPPRQHHHHPGPRHRRTGPRRRLRDPRPTSPGRASDDAGRHLPPLTQHQPIPTDRPHHRLPTRCGRQGSRPIPGRQLRDVPSSTTGSRPSADGRSSNPSPASTCGAIPSARTTSSTTPAPADSTRPATPPQRRLRLRRPRAPARRRRSCASSGDQQPAPDSSPRALPATDRGRSLHSSRPRCTAARAASEPPDGLACRR